MSPLSTPLSTTVGHDDDLTVARSAATELARLLPSTVPLQVVPFDLASAPAASAW